MLRINIVHVFYMFLIVFAFFVFGPFQYSIGFFDFSLCFCRPSSCFFQITFRRADVFIGTAQMVCGRPDVVHDLTRRQDLLRALLFEFDCPFVVGLISFCLVVLTIFCKLGQIIYHLRYCLHCCFQIDSTHDHLPPVS